MCGNFEGFDKGKHQLIIPDIDNSHYNIIDVMIDDNSDNYITKVLYYDSQERPAARLTTKNTINQEIKNSLQPWLEHSINSLST